MRDMWKNVALLLLSLIVALAAAEGLLRVLPTKHRVWFDYYADNRSTVAYQDSGGGLLIMRPQQRARSHGPCHNIHPIHVNAAGFRDGPWTVPKTRFRIALLGDSFLEGLHVSEGEPLAALLERMLDADILNAGISGYSTVTEWEAYRRLVRPYRPDLVVLFLYVGNDIKGNSCRLDPNRTLCGRVKNGEVDYRRAAVSAPAPQGTESRSQGQTSLWQEVKDFSRRHFVTYLVLHDLKVLLQGMSNYLTDDVPQRWQLYLPERKPEWEDAWRVTEHTLSRIKIEVERDGGQLVVVGINEFFSVSPDWRRELIVGAGSGVPHGFDPARALNDLREVARRRDIPFLDLLPLFIRYRDRHSLPYPYFSFSCDGHWSPLGHFVAANAVAEYLADNGFMGKHSSAGVNMRLMVERNLSMAPKDVLGTGAYEQIYEGEKYTGNSLTGKAVSKLR